MSIAERIQFFRAYLRNRQMVGSGTPSSRYLARALAEHISPSFSCVAELGPGTGPVTRAILKRAGPATSVVAFETEPLFCAWLQRAVVDPRLRIINAPAEELLAYVTELHLKPWTVVSSLPFGNFSLPLRQAIVNAAYISLVPGGTFVGFSYGSTDLQTTLGQVFGNCQARSVVRNLPPALVFSAHKSMTGR
jgi:phosphatidylethanolamine/phosphatidyl-N-methylethanolamine N-methyltransferase